MIRANSNESSFRYTAAWLGRFAKQKAVLYFRREPNATGRLFIIPVTAGSSVSDISTRLEKAGIANRTLVRRRRHLFVYVVDLKNELSTHVRTVARQFHRRASVLIGRGEFIGDDDRAKAQQIFSNEVEAYEKTHPKVRAACRRRLAHWWRLARIEAVKSNNTTV
jgi:hypothetical protein